MQAYEHKCVSVKHGADQRTFSSHIIFAHTQFYVFGRRSYVEGDVPYLAWYEYERKNGINTIRDDVKTIQETTPQNILFGMNEIKVSEQEVVGKYSKKEKYFQC